MVNENVIFLDIDGVLNCSTTEELTPDRFTGVESRFIANLAEVVNQFNASIVLSSDWKRFWEPDLEKCGTDAIYLNEQLANYGLFISDKTLDDSEGRNVYTERGWGIHQFLRDHPEIKRWIVIDDNQFRDFDAPIQNHFVYIAGTEEGFSEYYKNRAIRALNGEIQSVQREIDRYNARLMSEV